MEKKEKPIIAEKRPVVVNEPFATIISTINGRKASKDEKQKIPKAQPKETPFFCFLRGPSNTHKKIPGRKIKRI